MTGKGFHLSFSAASAMMGVLPAWLGGTALIVAALCFFMAGAFFERAYPGGVLARARRRKADKP